MPERRPEFRGGNVLPSSWKPKRVNDCHACGSSGPFRTTDNLPLAQTHNQRHNFRIAPLIRPQSANTMRHIVTDLAAQIRDTLPRRFSELAVFDARFYIRVRRIDKPA